ncbi:Hypothetical predicted protein [Paramuricea clavata]|uniref:Uncharacterized protein n=1 Tax=Paramuricea clavata TaxID=317549 RepID=A0A6S7GVH4_PARCT|nr:Hypothetical predicted protein [Paramuricea clavata]
MDECIKEDTEKKSDIEEDGSVILLQMLLKEKSTNVEAIIKLCSDNESIDDFIQNTIAPMLIGAGQLGSITPLYLASEGEIIIKFSNTNLINAVVVLILY